MTDDRKTPKEVRAENRKSWREDVGVAGKLIGVVLGVVAILGLCGGNYYKWMTVATKDDLREMKSEVITKAVTIVATEREESEAAGYAYVKATEDRLHAADEAHEKDIQYIKAAIDANGRRLEKLMDKIDRLRR